MSKSVFGSVPIPKKGRTVFNESHSVSGTFSLAKLQPVFFTETIPGDSWDIDVYNLSKLETLIAPAMQRIDASLLWFKIPKRLIFKHFKKWYSGGVDGQDNHQKPHIFLRKALWEMLNYLSIDQQFSDENVQHIFEYYFGPGSLWNYFGLPCPLSHDTTWKVDDILAYIDPQEAQPEGVDSDFIDIMPFMAYNMLYDQYFRDQTLSDPIFKDCDEGDFTPFKQSYYFNTIYFNGGSLILRVPAASGIDLSEGGEIPFWDFFRLLDLYNRAWKKEYFTSALPTAQRGPEVNIPIVDDTAPVTVNVPGLEVTDPDPVNGHVVVNADSDNMLSIPGEGGEYDKLAFKNLSGTADLTGLSPISIVAFRNLFKLQAFLEKNNIGGGRFIETILAQWAERVPDFTVQRAQHVRSTSIPIQISEVTATANSSGINSVVGDQGGRARVQGNLGRVHIYTHEPCFIIGLYNVTLPPAYASQGIERMWQRITRFDEPWRDFQHIGEQAVKTRELFFDFAGDNDSDFGYQQRFSEFKYMPDRVVGDFQTSLSYWHMARIFDSLPELNSDFVTQNPDERIFAVQNARPVFADFYFKAIAKRKLSKFSTPKLT